MGYGKSLRGTPDEIHKRRSLIKKWVMEEGLTNREEMWRRLKDEGISVTRQTVYNDLKVIAKFTPEDVEGFELDCMAEWKKMIRALSLMIDKETDTKTKARLIKDLSTVMKDRIYSANQMIVEGKPKEKKQKQDTSEVNISFG